MKNKEDFIAATDEDLMEPILYDKYLGIFYKVNAKTLQHIRANSVVQNFDREDVVFPQNYPTNRLPLYIVLSGKYAVQHTTEDGLLEVAIDDPGTVIADVEFLVADIEDEITKRGKKNRTRANIVCVAPGRLLAIYPPSTIWDTKSFQLAVNLSRLLAIKLLNRNAFLDPGILARPSKLIIRHLNSLVATYGTEEFVAEDQSKQRRLQKPITQAQMAKEIHVSKQVLSSYKNRLEDVGLTWTRNEIIMTEEFLYRLMNDIDSFATMRKHNHLTLETSE